MSYINDDKVPVAEPGRYKITRRYRDVDRWETIVRGLTLEQAQVHCQNPETSSSTCTTPEGLERTKQFGPWFDGYDVET